MAGKREVLLTDEQWEMAKPFIPEIPATRHGGRPRADDRACFEGILWVLRSGARWKDLPDRYPSPSTCWRRLAEWEEAGVFVDMWHAFIDELDEQGRINWDEIFMDGSFAPAKKGATTWVKPNVEKVQSGWWWQMAKEYLWHVPSTRRPKRK
ncbi:MAG: transposase [Blastopirellula sp. JB062]